MIRVLGFRVRVRVEYNYINRCAYRVRVGVRVRVLVP